MANTQLQFLLMSVYILVTQTTKGAFGAVSNGPLNSVVYEGATNTTMTCEATNSFIPVKWVLAPFAYTGSSNSITITTGAEVNPPFAESFAIDHPDGTHIYTLVVFNATIYPIDGATFSTAGYYQCHQSNIKSAYLVVIRTDPVCSSNFTQSTAMLQSGDVIQLSCTIVYGAWGSNRIDANMTWSVNGQPIPADNFTITSTPTEVTALSTLLINDNFDATYECATTFSLPPAEYAETATNAPDYFKTCTTSPITTSTTSSAPTTTTGLPPCNGLFNFVSNLLRASCYTDWIVCSLEINILGINLWPNCRSHCNNNGGTCIPSTSVGCPCIHPGNKKCQCS